METKMKLVSDVKAKIINATNHKDMSYCFTLSMACGSHCSTICPIKLARADVSCLSYNMIIWRLK